MKLSQLARLAMFICLFYGGYSCVRAKDGGFTVAEVNKERIASLIGEEVRQGQFPLVVNIDGKNAGVVYKLHTSQQRNMEKWLRQYAPDYGAFVALDAKTGAILTLASFSRSDRSASNLALRASFPAASVFKVVTAAAAIDQNKIDSDTLIEFNGANHTLYRKNVIQSNVNRWTRKISIREAFGRSVNTVFGKLGVFFLKPSDLEEYAQRFQFNQNISIDVPVESGTFVLNPEDYFGIAEAASGYSRLSLMSPLQGAMMAAALINQGVMMEPYLVDKIIDQDQDVIYKAYEKPVAVTVTKKTAVELKKLMEATIKSGTSQKSFRDFARKNKWLNLEIGGKTGSLTGNSPKGKYDWFMGYASDGNHKIALCALTINEDNWRVKSSYLARMYIESYFREIHPPPSKKVRQIANTNE